MVALIIIAAFLLLFLIGAPLVLAIALPSTVYVLLHGIPIELIVTRYLYSLDSFTLTAIPLFIFTGNLMNVSGITRRLFRFADVLVGRVPGGLAQVNIFASLIFSGMSGAALADVGGLGRIEIEAMTDRGFPKGFSAGVTIASATVGPIFPPSIPLVLFGAVTGTSIIKLLLAGITPAIIAVILMMIMTAYIAVRRQYPRRDKAPTVREVIVSLIPALPALMAPVLLIGGMLSGLFTPTEAASFVVAYMLLIGILVYRDFSFKHLIVAAVETIKQTAAICIILAAAALFGWVMTVENVPTLFMQAMTPFMNNRVLLLIVVNLLMFIVGMFLDSNTATLIVIPIIMPTLLHAGLDPVHVGIVIVFNLMLGLMTPPLGLSLLMVTNMVKLPLGKVFRESSQYFIPLIATLGIITFIPVITLWIPNFVR